MCVFIIKVMDLNDPQDCKHPDLPVHFHKQVLGERDNRAEQEQHMRMIRELILIV